MNQRTTRLLTAFIKADTLSEQALIWQPAIPIGFPLSALAIAWTEQLTRQPEQAH